MLKSAGCGHFKPLLSIKIKKNEQLEQLIEKSRHHKDILNEE